MGVYIPIWLDLLCRKYRISKTKSTSLHSNMVRFIMTLQQFLITIESCLHSNMVRFIIIIFKNRRDEKIIVYIPIWLDLLILRFI